MPKELVAVAPQNRILRDYEDGPVPEGHVRVKIEFGATKRGTEMTGYYGLRRNKFPMGLGATFAWGGLWKLEVEWKVSQ